MSISYPPSLGRVLTGRDEAEREAGWEAFVAEHSRLILHTARRASSGHDEVMDRYAYVLERLREDDFHRLRAFSPNGTGKFSTWLVVVVRRLCIDHHRTTFGRQPRGEKPADELEREARNNLAALVGADVDPDDIADTDGASPDAGLLRDERNARLAAALAELSTRDQLLLTLRYVDGHSPAKVARMLALPSRFAVHRRLTTLKQSLRERIGDREDSE